MSLPSYEGRGALSSFPGKEVDWQLQVTIQHSRAPPLAHGFARGVEHTLSTGEGLIRPLGLFATVKEAPTPVCGHAVDTWAIIEDVAPSQAALSVACRVRRRPSGSCLCTVSRH